VYQYSPPTALRCYFVFYFPGSNPRLNDYNHSHEGANSAEGDKLLAYLGGLFDAADLDESGDLSPEEIVGLLREFYRAQTISRSTKKIYRLVCQCLDEYDMDRTGETHSHD